VAPGGERGALRQGGFKDNLMLLECNRGKKILPEFRCEGSILATVHTFVY
jgi:hypothetical protein